MKNTFGCVKNTIRLLSGQYLDLADPNPNQFTFNDIAGALSKICRFGGQVERFYSVAEHCVRCARQAREDGFPLDTQMACLMHDAAEAFCGDVVKPLKIMLREYADIEARIEAVIAEKFMIDFRREEEIVHEIDHAMLINERRHLFSADQVVWVGEKAVRRLDGEPECWEPEAARVIFTREARMIGIEVAG